MKFVGTLIVMVLLVAFSAPQAQAQLGWFAGGYLFGSMNGEVINGSSQSDVVYQLARASERVVDPLEVRTTATGNYFSGRNDTKRNFSLKELFGFALQKSKISVKSADHYTILRITRKINFERNDMATYWFEYISNEYVRDVSELKPLTKAP